MKIQMENISDVDVEVVKNQIKKSSIFICGIAKRCKFGHPVVAVLDPVFDDEEKTINYSALKNPLWLTCPYLNREIHKIEDNFGVQKIQKFIRSDRSYKIMMEDAHAHYYFFRKELFTEVSGKPFAGDLLELFNSGIGGVRDVTSIKCLHMHYAHYLFCEDNLAGKMTEMLLDGKRHCGKEECKWQK